jgi:hypothetical protein
MGRAVRLARLTMISLTSGLLLVSAAAARLMPGPGGVARIATFTPNTMLQNDVNADIGIYAADLHHKLGLTVIAGVVNHEIKTEDGNLIYANATPLNAKGKGEGPDAPVKCQIQETPLGVSKGPAFEALTMAHELFHCFQFDLRGTDAWKSMPFWVQEGTADWAATTIDPSPFDLDNDFLELGKYFGHPRESLFNRSYDASGFWGHLQDVNGDLWDVLPKVIRADDSRAAFVAAGADDGAVLDTWASSYLRNPTGDAGEAWQMHSPMVPPASNQDQLDSLPVPILQLSGQAHVWANPYTVIDYHFASMPADEPLMNIKLHGYGRLSVPHNYTHLSDAWFCVDPAGCKCPPDTTAELPSAQPLETDAYLAITGDPDDPDGSSGEITFHKLDEFCHKKQKPPPPTPKYNYGNGGDGGDPHLTTFDGEFYDFQAAGEFTAIRSSRGDMIVQVRQEPYRRGKTPNPVAVIEAVAVRDGRVIFEADDHGHTWLNRRPIKLRNGLTKLSGGGSLKDDYGEYTLTWRDGSFVTVSPWNYYGADVVVHAAKDRRHHLAGLLGPYSGGKPASDFVGRTGIHYRASDQGQLPFGVLYGEYGNSWRITQKQSLFVYPRGKGTRSYTKLGYPPGTARFSRLSNKARAKAKNACLKAGIKVKVVLADCELDVGVTGDTAFAGHDKTLEQAAVGHVPTTTPGVTTSPIPWTQLSSTPTHLSGVSPTIASSAGQVVAAYRNGVAGNLETATFMPSSGGVAGLTRTAAISGWISVGDPFLIAGPAGTLQLLAAGTHSNNSPDPQNGTVIEPRAANGTFGTPTQLSPTNDCCLTSAVVAANGSTPLWTADPAYDLLVYGGATEHDLSAAGSGSENFPAIGRDASGRLWLAWYVFSETPNVSGLYMLQVDSQTYAPVGAAAHVPDSDGGAEFGVRLALACASTCRLVYEAQDGTDRIVTWAPGEGAPAQAVGRMIGKRTLDAPGAIQAGYSSKGRLWIVWENTEDNLQYAELGDARGAGAAPIQLRAIHGYTEPGATAVTAIGSRLAVATNWADGSAGTSAVFGTVVDAPQ